MLGLVVLQFVRMVVAFPGFLPHDDPYIILVYARNVLHGELFTYNPGVYSSAITCPLYALALAAVYPLFENWHATVLCFGSLCFATTLILGSRIAWHVAGRWAATAFLVICGLCGRQAIFALMGMETALVIPLGLAASLAFIRGRPLLAGALAGLTMLCRPEAFLLAFAFMLPALWQIVRSAWKRDWAGLRAGMREGLKIGGAFLVIMLPWMIYCLHVSNTLLSSTVFLKAQAFDPSAALHFIRQSLFLHFMDGWDVKLFTQQVMPPSAFMAVKGAIPLGALALFSLFLLRGRERLGIPLLFYPAHIALAAVKCPGAAGEDRYLALDYALVYLYSAIVIGSLVGGLPPFPRLRGIWRNVLRISGVIVLAGWGLLLFGDHSFCRHSYAFKGCYFRDLDYVIGYWLKQNSQPNARVLLYQAGGIAFFGERRIIDMWAVTDHTMERYLKMPGGTLQALVDREADYVASFGDDRLDSDGVSLGDTNLFTRVPLRCRGLYKVNKPAVRAAFDRLQASGRFQSQ